jgi:hypothetical protein
MNVTFILQVCRIPDTFSGCVALLFTLTERRIHIEWCIELLHKSLSINRRSVDRQALQ